MVTEIVLIFGMDRIPGVSIQNKDGCYLCLITDFSNELKEVLKDNLVALCEGWYRANNEKHIYTLKQTLKELVKRINDKPEDTQKGMIGELLSHVLLVPSVQNLTVLSPYFNLEDRGVKKGFDLIFSDKANNEIWLTEVKSGEKNEIQTVNDKNIELIDVAKNDLKGNLLEKETGRWKNALNGFDISQRGRDETKFAKRILADNLGLAEQSGISSTSQNAILVSVVFCDHTSQIEIEKIIAKKKKIQEQQVFKNIILFSFQKGTYQKVLKYLQEEGARV